MGCRRVLITLVVAGTVGAAACADTAADDVKVFQQPPTDSTRGSATDSVPAKRDSAPPSAKASAAIKGPSPTPALRIEPGSTRLGVYTAEQAAEGYDVYLGMCNSCHAGLGNHSGEVFKQRWGDRSLVDLFDYMSEYMPKSDPGSLSPEDNVRVMAYLLKVNGMPAGRVALPTERAALEQLWMDTASTRK